MRPSYDRVFAGIDWSMDTNEVCVIDASGAVLAQKSFEHSPTGLERLAEQLLEAGGGEMERVSVAIEVPHGPVVELLMERGARVFSINPKQLDRFRDRFTVAGAKDDRLDARVLADSLRTDERHYRELEPTEPLVVELREHSRIHTELQRDKVRLGNRLREQLRRYYPQFLDAVPALDRLWALALLKLVPTPRAARQAKMGDVRAVLKAHRSRQDARALLDALRQPAFKVAAGTVEAASAHVGVEVARLRLVVELIRDCRRELDALTARLIAEPAAGPEGESGQRREQHDLETLLSFPGAGRIVGAALLAEASRLVRERDYHGLRTLSGMAPVTRRSGRMHSVRYRRACNPRLRDAMYHWARVACQVDAVWKDRYATLRAAGHSHGRALRTVGDRLLRVLCAVLSSGARYDAARLRRAA